jgi:hypothetical protein
VLISIFSELEILETTYTYTYTFEVLSTDNALIVHLTLITLHRLHITSIET